MQSKYLLLFMSLVPIAHADDLRDCADIESDEARLSCYDDLAGRPVDSAPEQPPELSGATELPSAPEAVSAQQLPAPAPVPAAEPGAAATPEELFGKSEEAKNAAIAEAAGVEDISKMYATVTHVAEDAYGKITIKLDNGQRWRQVRPERFDVETGDEIVVSRGALRSFNLQRKSGGRKTKVRRVD